MSSLDGTAVAARFVYGAFTFTTTASTQLPALLTGPADLLGLDPAAPLSLLFDQPVFLLSASLSASLTSTSSTPGAWSASLPASQIRADGASVYARRAALSGEGERVRFRLLPGRTHLNGWLSEACCERNRVQDARFHAATDMYGFFVSKKAEEEFYAPIGREERIALSEADGKFFDELDAFYADAGRKSCQNTI